MKLIIDIDEDVYESALNDTYTSIDEGKALDAIRHGKELITCEDCKFYTSMIPTQKNRNL